MKFDLVIGNPPYESAKHLQIHKVLSGLVKEHGRIVFVHPSTFMISRKGGNSYARYVDVSKLESLHLFWANELFNIQSFVPVCISSWEKDRNDGSVRVIDDAYTKSTYVSKVDEVHMYGPLFPKFMSWFNSNVDFPLGNIPEHGSKDASTEYPVTISTMRGHPPLDDTKGLKDDFFTMLPQDNATIEKTFGKRHSQHYKNIFSFNSEQERSNFILYLKSKCVRFLLSLSKFSQMLFRGEMNRIPWMDFTKAWRDSELRVLWNIDDGLWEFIDSHIPDYYTDYSYCGIM